MFNPAPGLLRLALDVYRDSPGAIDLSQHECLQRFRHRRQYDDLLRLRKRLRGRLEPLGDGQGGFGNDETATLGPFPGKGFNNVPMQCDPSVNSPDPEDTNASGALLLDIPAFETTDSADYDGGITGVLFGQFKNDYIYDTGGTTWAIDASLYESISFDIMVSNTVIPSASGDFGTIGVGFIAEGTPRGGDTYGNPTIPGSAQGAWQHIVVPLPKGGVQNANEIVGWCFKYGVSETPGYPTNGQHITFWLDNIRANLAPPVPPPTLLSVTPAVNGLNLWEVGTDTNQDEDIESGTQGGNGWQLATAPPPLWNIN